MNTKVLIGVIFLHLSLASFAKGQAGLTFGTEYGIGFVAQVGSHATKLEIGGGVVPFLFFATSTFGDDITKIYFPGTIGAKLSFGTKKSDDENRLGIKLGVSYNTLIKTGFGGGIDYQVAKDPKLVIGGGVMIYPDAKDELRARINEDEGTNYTDEEFSAPLASFQPFVSFSILFGK